MTTTSPITASGANAAQGISTNPMGSMNSDDFMLLLLAQLRNQNPLEPMQDKDLMDQFTQLNSLQELQSIDSGLQNLYQSNQLTEAAGLIGKEVEVATGNSDTLTGVVNGVSLISGQLMLFIDDQTVPLSALLSVRSQVPLEEGPTR